MHILVAAKRVVDPNVRVRLRESGVASKVTVAVCDGPAAQDVLRTAPALGADAAIRIDTSADGVGEHAPARLPAEWVRREAADLALCGKQTVDDELGDTVPMLPAVLGVDLRLCDARAVSLPGLIKARKACIQTLPASRLAQAQRPRGASARIVGVAGAAR